MVSFSYQGRVVVAPLSSNYPFSYCLSKISPPEDVPVQCFLSKSMLVFLWHAVISQRNRGSQWSLALVTRYTTLRSGGQNSCTFSFDTKGSSHFISHYLIHQRPRLVPKIQSKYIVCVWFIHDGEYCSKICKFSPNIPKFWRKMKKLSMGLKVNYSSLLNVYKWGRAKPIIILWHWFFTVSATPTSLLNIFFLLICVQSLLMAWLRA